jgi:hypothetical protein
MIQLVKIYQLFTVRGEFRGQAFEADYSSDDGWHAGNGIQALDSDFAESDQYDDWHDDLLEYLQEHGLEAAS